MGILGNMLHALADGAGGYTMGDALSGQKAPKPKSKPKIQGPPAPKNQSNRKGAAPKNRTGFVFDPSSPSSWSYVNERGVKANAKEKPEGYEKIVGADSRMSADNFDKMNTTRKLGFVNHGLADSVPNVMKGAPGALANPMYQMMRQRPEPSGGRGPSSEHGVPFFGDMAADGESQSPAEAWENAPAPVQYAGSQAANIMNPVHYYNQVAGPMSNIGFEREPGSGWPFHWKG